MADDASNFPIIIFADGASSGNPGPGGWGAIVATPEGRVREFGGGERETTNNRMELAAVIVALESLGATGHRIHVYTDSVYVIRGITQWIWGWMKRGWKTAEGNEVANPDLWQRLSRATRGKKIDWKWVRGHSGVPGNERVDEIAVYFTRGSRPRLYDGPLLGYDIALHDVPENTELPERKPEKEVKKAAFSYLSLVGNTPMRHANWSECERRVKGVSGAKFKKAMSEAEEKEILTAWGFKIADVK